jgi:hypothetical protein
LFALLKVTVEFLENRAANPRIGWFQHRWLLFETGTLERFEETHSDVTHEAEAAMAPAGFVAKQQAAALFAGLAKSGEP